MVIKMAKQGPLGRVPVLEDLVPPIPIRIQILGSGRTILLRLEVAFSVVRIPTPDLAQATPTLALEVVQQGRQDCLVRNLLLVVFSARLLLPASLVAVSLVALPAILDSVPGLPDSVLATPTAVSSASRTRLKINLHLEDLQTLAQPVALVLQGPQALDNRITPLLEEDCSETTPHRLPQRLATTNNKTRSPIRLEAVSDRTNKRRIRLRGEVFSAGLAVITSSNSRSLRCLAMQGLLTQGPLYSVSKATNPSSLLDYLGILTLSNKAVVSLARSLPQLVPVYLAIPLKAQTLAAVCSVI